MTSIPASHPDAVRRKTPSELRAKERGLAASARKWAAGVRWSAMALARATAAWGAAVKIDGFGVGYDR
jgi:hypothetical protein